MKTKDLIVGQQYAIRRRDYGPPLKGLLLSTDKYVQNTRTGHPAPVNTALGERGGLAFAVQRIHDERWVPFVVQPNAVFAPFEDFDAAQAALRAKQEAEYQAQRAEAERRNQEAKERRAAAEARTAKLISDLEARGVDGVVLNYGLESATVSVEALEQLVRRLKPKAA